jgi:hypothetical protein
MDFKDKERDDDRECSEAALPSSLADADEVGSRVMALNASVLPTKAQERQLRTGASTSNAGMSSILFRWSRRAA